MTLADTIITMGAPGMWDSKSVPIFDPLIRR